MSDSDNMSYADYLIPLIARKAVVRTFDSVDAAALVYLIMEIGENDRKNSRYVLDEDEETLAFQMGLSIPKLRETLKIAEEVVEKSNDGYIVYYIALVEAMARVYPDLREGDNDE